MVCDLGQLQLPEALFEIEASLLRCVPPGSFGGESLARIMNADWW